METIDNKINIVILSKNLNIKSTINNCGRLHNVIYLSYSKQYKDILKNKVCNNGTLIFLSELDENIDDKLSYLDKNYDSDMYYLYDENITYINLKYEKEFINCHDIPINLIFLYIITKNNKYLKLNIECIATEDGYYMSIEDSVKPIGFGCHKKTKEEAFNTTIKLIDQSIEELQYKKRELIKYYNNNIK